MPAWKLPACRVGKTPDTLQTASPDSQNAKPPHFANRNLPVIRMRIGSAARPLIARPPNFSLIYQLVNS